MRYLHRKLDFYEEITAPDVAATNFLVSLTKRRKKQTYSILSFVNGVVTKYEGAPDDQKNAKVMYIGASPTFTNFILYQSQILPTDKSSFFVPSLPLAPESIQGT